MSPKKHTAFIALGANLGNPLETCNKALNEIKNHSDITLISHSTWHKTKPLVAAGESEVGVPDYINGACEIETSLKPEDLLNTLLGIEKKLGRTRGKKWESRVIDLDLLFYDDLVLNETNAGGHMGPPLQIPHPELHKRDFVLKPLMEIAPDFVHPVLKKTIREL